MKHLIYLFCFSLLFAACSSSDDDDNNDNDNTNYEELIIGQWARISVLQDGEPWDNLCANGVSFTFGQDGYYGEGQNNTNDCSFTGNSGEYSLNGSTLIINSAFLEATAEILNLDANTLRYKFTSINDVVKEYAFVKEE